MQQSNFDNFSNSWWSDNGPLKLLHSMNKTRMLFIQERILNRYQSFDCLESIFNNKSILDLGCGGGILSEALAKKGAKVNAYDISKSLIKVAKKRAIEKKLTIDYKVGGIELLKKQSIKFDIIILDVMMPGQNGYDLTKEIK